MSIKLVSMVLELPAIGRANRLVLLGLADCSNAKTGLCFPSKATLATVAECTPRQVQRSLRDLEDMGLISTVQRPGRSSLYALFPNGIHALRGDIASPQGETQRLGGGDTRVSGGETPASPEPERTGIKHLTEPSTDVDNSASYHYCRSSKTMAIGPKSHCTEGCTDPAEESTG